MQDRPEPAYYTARRNKLCGRSYRKVPCLRERTSRHLPHSVDAGNGRLTPPASGIAPAPERHHLRASEEVVGEIIEAPDQPEFGRELIVVRHWLSPPSMRPQIRSAMPFAHKVRSAST